MLTIIIEYDGFQQIDPLDYENVYFIYLLEEETLEILMNTIKMDFYKWDWGE